MIRIAAVADLHLGKTSTQVPDNFDASVKNALVSVKEFCIAEKIDLLFMVGDIVDRENKYFEAYTPLRDSLTELVQNGVHIYIVGGNHDFDVLPQILRSIPSENIHFLGEKGIWEVLVYEKDDEKIQILGWSFPSTHFLNSPLIDMDKSIIDRTMPCIGLVHGDYYDKNSQYGPLDHHNLNGTGVVAWILGHIHKHDIIRSRDPLLVYPGSPQGLSPKETGKHGIITFEVKGRAISSLEFHQISHLVYETIDIEMPLDLEQENLRSHIMKHLEVQINKLKQNYPKAEFVIDLNFIGYNPNRELMENFKGELSGREYIFPQVSIRKVNLGDLKPAIQNLDALAEEKSIVGALAGIVKDLQAGDSNSALVKEILKEIKRQRTELLNSNTYNALKDPIDDEMDSKELKRLVINEAQHILIHFTEQLNRA